MANKKVTPGEITIMAGGAVALIASFLPFYSAPSTNIPGVGSVGGDDISAWGDGLFPVATLIAIFALVMAVVVALDTFANVNLPERVVSFSWTQIHLALGFFAAVLAVAYLLVDNGGYDLGIGYFGTLIGAVAVLVGAVLLMRERATA